MARSSADYLAMLQALLPLGPAWTRDPSSNLTALLSARADRLAAIDASIDTLLLEMDPRTAVATLSGWEGAFGLPLPGSALAADVPDRQDAVVQQMTFEPGASRDWWLGQASALGFDQAEIVEHRPFRAGQSAAGQPCSSDPWRFRWDLIVYSTASASNAAAILRARVARYAQGHVLCVLTFVDPNASLFEYNFLGGP